MSNLTRIKNSQIADSSIFANTKIAPGTIVGSLFSSNLVIATDITISGNLTVQGTSHTGIVYANAGIASTSTTTGAIVVTGGLGVSGNIYAGSIISAPTVSATSLSLSNALPIASGGTNSTATPTAGGIGYGTGTAHAYTAVGTSGQVLTSAGTGVPAWISTLPIVNGGTGISTLTAGYIPYGNGTGALSSSSNLYFSGVNLGVGTVTPAFNLQVNGSFAATSKSFLIDHPTNEGMKLCYGSLESPYHGVRLTGNATLINGKCTVQLPDYICGLCKQEGSQVQITNIKHGKVIWVDTIDVKNNTFSVECDTSFFDRGKYDFYWSFTGIRKDVEDLVVEF